jgi:hypothetical protein
MMKDITNDMKLVQEHLHCSSVYVLTLHKCFSHPSSVFVFFPTPAIKLKLGLQFGGRLLMATNMDGSNYQQVLGFVLPFTSLTLQHSTFFESLQSQGLPWNEAEKYFCYNLSNLVVVKKQTVILLYNSLPWSLGTGFSKCLT